MKGNAKEQPKKAPSIIRQVFRLPIEQEDQVSLNTGGKSYEVINLGPTGVGILLDGEPAFSIGQGLDEIILQLAAEHLQLKGRIVHISPRDFRLICGIEFLGIGENDQNRILHFLSLQKEKLFGHQPSGGRDGAR